MTTTKLINLTPHAIVLRKGDMEVTIKPDGTVARVTSFSGAIGPEEFVDPTGNTFKFPVAEKTKFGEVVGLPVPTPGVMFIVSGMVGAALAAQGGQGRSDVVMPGTGPEDNAIRNEKGQIVAVTRLVHVD